MTKKKKQARREGDVSPRQKITANALNELDATGEEERIPEMKPSSRARVALAISTSILQCAGGAGGGSFLLFFDGFIVSVWASLYACSLAHAALLVCGGAIGIAAIVTKKVLAVRLYVVASVLLLGTAAVCSSFIIEGYVNNDSEIADTWASRISSGAASQSYLCDVERIMHCTGWSSPCEVRSQAELLR